MTLKARKVCITPRFDNFSNSGFTHTHTHTQTHFVPDAPICHFEKKPLQFKTVRQREMGTRERERGRKGEREREREQLEGEKERHCERGEVKTTGVISPLLTKSY